MRWLVPGLKAEEVFKQVRIEVSGHSNGLQIPWESSSLTGEFVFNFTKVESVSVTTVQPPSTNTDALFWESIKDSKDPEDLRAYLEQFPDGVFAKLATNRLARLSTSGTQIQSAAEPDESVALAAPGSASTQPELVTGSQSFIEVKFTTSGRQGLVSGLLPVSGDRINGEIRSDDGAIRLQGRLVDKSLELTGTIRPARGWHGYNNWHSRQFKIKGTIKNGVLVQTMLTGTGGALVTSGWEEFETTVSIRSHLASPD